MTVADRLIDVCEKLPGFYGYRPSMSENRIVIDEILFRLSDEENECEYLLTITLHEHKCMNAVIDARYSDGSIARVMDEDEEFEDIISHKNKLMNALNRYL